MGSSVKRRFANPGVYERENAYQIECVSLEDFAALEERCKLFEDLAKAWEKSWAPENVLEIRACREAAKAKGLLP